MFINYKYLASFDVYFEKIEDNFKIELNYQQLSSGTLLISLFIRDMESDNIKEFYSLDDEKIPTIDDANEFFGKLTLKKIRKKYKNLEDCICNDFAVIQNTKSKEAGREQ